MKPSEIGGINQLNIIEVIVKNDNPHFFLVKYITIYQIGVPPEPFKKYPAFPYHWLKTLPQIWVIITGIMLSPRTVVV